MELEELEDEAHELCRLLVRVSPTDVAELDGVVDDRGRVEGEAVLLFWSRELASCGLAGRGREAHSSRASRRSVRG